MSANKHSHKPPRRIFLGLIGVGGAYVVADVLLRGPLSTLVTSEFTGKRVTTASTTSLTSSSLFVTTSSSPVQVTLPDLPSKLLGNTADFQRAYAAIQTYPLAFSLFENLKNQARSFLKESPYQYSLCKESCHEPNPTMLVISRGVVQRIYTLGVMYRLGEGDVYFDRAWNELKAVAKFPDWNPSSFLDTAEMTHAFAIGYDWFPWNMEQRSVIRDAIVNFGLKPALEAYQGKANYGWWVDANNNWNLVCNSGIGMGALAIASERPDLSQQILDYAFKSLPKALLGFWPDGGWFEGPSYWNYATLYISVFLASLRNALGTDRGLSQTPGFSESGLFPIYCTGPNGRTFNFADSGDTRLQAPQMYWLGREFARPLYSSYAGGDDLTNGDYACAGPCLGSALGLLWFQSDAQDHAASNLEPSKYFHGLELATLRTSWNDQYSTFVGLKAGQNGLNHGHLDLGSFVVDALGIRWAIDLGSDDYSLPGYFSEDKRWTYYRVRAEGHNTLVINQSKGPDQEPRATAKITRFKTQLDKTFAIADLAPAYSSLVLRLERGIALLDHGSIIIQDEVTAKQPIELWWFMHTRATVSIDADGRAATLQSGSYRLWCAIASPIDANFKLMDAKPLPSSPKPEGQDQNLGVQKLAMHLRLSGPATISVMMYPLRSDQEPPAQLPTVPPLYQWGGTGWIAVAF